MSIPKWITVPSVLIALLSIIPILYLLIRSLDADQQTWQWIMRPNTLFVLGRSVALTFSVTLICILISIPIGWITTHTNVPYRRFWSIVTILPLVIPSYIGAYIFISIMGPSGFITQLLATLGIDFKMPSLYGFVGSTFTLSFLSFPYILLTVRSALVNLDPILLDASHVLGIKKSRTLLRITIPQLRAATISGGLLVALYTLSDFGAVSLLRYKTFTWSIYAQYEASFDRHTAALMSLVLFSVAMTIIVIFSAARNRAVYYRSSSGSKRPNTIFNLGKMKWLAFAFCGLVFVVSIVTPVFVLSTWLVKGVLNGERLDNLFTMSMNSIALALATSVLVVLISIPVSYLATRHRGIFSQAIEKLCFTGFALPSIAVALALVFVGAQIGRPLYQSLWLLILGCGILFIPAGIGSVKTSILQINPRLEDSARTLGKSQFIATTKTTIPLIKSGIFMAFATVFLITMKELPAVLLLAPLYFHTLTTAIWSYSSEAFFARAAFPSIIILLISAIPMSVILFFQGGSPKSVGQISDIRS